MASGLQCSGMRIPRAALESWQLNNLQYDIKAISRRDLPELLGDFAPEYEQVRQAMEVRSEFGRRYIPADAESDLLRLALLYRHGGCWADSTMLCRRPLDDWLPQATEASGCFAFAPE
eukprot:CAMPEP_0204174854 /NCGR_PEP_ID=MMETSP0361-20130328/46253_1 /ASSEMBLY_ACC=CAM_ASM_000343 /TAXON_ID=268821 /ORGANISM="Scrippsiella Hangoei, Strain SHTV-5" /LENGTH=117 /DNA_ID=CAMNT_0051133407 /DNA_START=26 /DNA_END=375 /DNA_ORIENTATION=-